MALTKEEVLAKLEHMANIQQQAVASQDVDVNTVPWTQGYIACLRWVLEHGD